MTTKHISDWLLLLLGFVIVGSLCFAGCGTNETELDPVAQRIMAANRNSPVMTGADYSEMVKEIVRTAKRDTVIITRVDTIFRDTCAPVAKKSIVP